MTWIEVLAKTSLKRLHREVTDLEDRPEARVPGSSEWDRIHLRLAAHHAFHVLEILGREIYIADALERGGRQDGETTR